MLLSFGWSRARFYVWPAVALMVVGLLFLNTWVVGGALVFIGAILILCEFKQYRPTGEMRSSVELYNQIVGEVALSQVMYFLGIALVFCGICCIITTQPVIEELVLRVIR